MATFNLRRLLIPLKTALSNDVAFRTAVHSGGITRSISFDATTLALVETRVGRRLQGSLVDISDFVFGVPDDSTDAPDVGLMGEALTFLLFLEAGRDIVRVQGVNAGTFKRPDFVEFANGKVRLVEVKTTDAFTFKSWDPFGTGARPCARLKEATSQALKQLGLDVSGLPVTPAVAYTLTLLKDVRTPAFPGDEATAVAVLIRDGRLERRRSLTQLSATESCAVTAPRQCVDCLGTGLGASHLTFAELPNAPGIVPLRGTGESGREWFDAYTRWTKALWVGYIPAVVEAGDVLWRSIEAWVSGALLDDGAEEWDLLEWWRATMTFSAAAVGVGAAEQWFDAESPFLSARRSALRVVPGRSASLTGPGDKLIFGEDTSRNLRFSATITPAGFDLRAQTTDGVTSPDVVAVRLANLALALEGRVGNVRRLPVAPVTFGAGLVLGWFVPSLVAGGFGRTRVKKPPHWYRSLRYAASDSVLHVLPDGRARLRSPWAAL